MKKKLEWNVWEYPTIWSGTEPYLPGVVNIFDHYKFSLDLYNIKKKKLQRKEFEEELKRALKYSFWAKCEYELQLLPWPNSENDKGYKIDIWNQIEANWNRFADYVWENQKLIPRVEDYRKLSRKVEKYVDANLKKPAKKSVKRNTVNKTKEK